MKIIKISNKTHRNDGSVTLWHISHESFSKLKPRSNMPRLMNDELDKTGLFFSPSYNSLILDWAFYVAGKKNEKFTKIIDEKIDAIDEELEEKYDIKYQKTKELELENDLYKKEEVKRDINNIQQDIENMEEKISDLAKKKNKIKSNSYKEIYIYKIRCPRKIFTKYTKQFQQSMSQEKDMSRFFSFWAWGSQIFISQVDLDQLSIVSKKKLSEKELREEYARIQRGYILSRQPKTKKSED